jgi:hypothetical protein
VNVLNVVRVRVRFKVWVRVRVRVRVCIQALQNYRELQSLAELRR